VIGDVVVVGSAVADNGRVDMPSGEVRGYDVRTGKRIWTWDPAPGTRVGGANAWSMIVADGKRGLVFVPTGSASPDYYGGMRMEANHANSVVALEARTGKMVWNFQTVRHDLWDYDVASPPVLLRAKGRDAVAVGSKTGHLFLLDRETGKPVFGVEERAVPESDAEGEAAAERQPFPVLPPALSRQTFAAWGPDEKTRAWCEEAVKGMRNEGVFTPPSVRGTVSMPGNIGGLHWGGAAYDGGRGLLVAPSNNLAAVVRLIPRAEFGERRRGDRLGMEFAAQAGTPYGMARQFLLSPAGLPCVAPPWGVLTAVDTQTGRVRWQVPLGEMGGQPGAINLGGPILTAGGLTFIGATVDGYLRAFATESGKELWKAKLPASARATPMTYVHQGRQYVVIAAGGHDEKLGPMGDEVVAFALR
jgi:quinoprotein glucose dehydrogenase